MNHVDLTSGVGGFALAARWMGWNTIAFCEIDEFCQMVLSKNFGKAIPIFPDLFKLSYAAIKSFHRKFGTLRDRSVDIVSAGLPCQPYSHAGKREGKDDERFLFPAFFKLIPQFRSKWIVLENVRGLLSIHNGELFEDIIAHLESEGYEVATLCIPASAIGAPHKRDRVWIIAHNREFVVRPGRTFSRTVGTAPEEARSGWQGQIRDTSTHCNRTTAASESAGLARRQRSQRSGRNEFNGQDKRSLADAIGKRLQGGEFGRASGESSRTSRPITQCYENENWLQVAARLCRVDDGLPRGLDEAGDVPAAAKNKTSAGRAHRLRGLGNAVHPLVVLEIFKAIEAADKEINF